MPFPHGANVSAPAALFLTVHGTSADLLDAVTERAGAPAAPPAATVDRDAPPDRGARAARRLGPGHRQSSASRPASACGTRPAGATSRPQPAADATHPGGAGARRPTGVLQRRLPLRRAAARTSATPERRRRQRRLVARPRRRATRCGRRHLAVPRRRRLPQARRRRRTTTAACRRPARSTASSRATSRPRRAPTLDRELRRARQRPARASYPGSLQPYAIYVPRKPRPAARLRHDAAAALARRQLQPVPRQPQPVAVRRARRGLDRDHAGRARARRLVYDSLAAADMFEVWADVARRYKLDPDWTVDHRLLDGRHRHLQARDAVPRPVRRAQPTVGPRARLWVPRAARRRALEHDRDARLAAQHPGPDVERGRGRARAAARHPAPGARARRPRLPLRARHLPPASTSRSRSTTSTRPPRSSSATRRSTATRRTSPTSPTRASTTPTLGFVADHAYWLSAIALREGAGDAPSARSTRSRTASAPATRPRRRPSSAPARSAAATSARSPTPRRRAGGARRRRSRAPTRWR